MSPAPETLAAAAVPDEDEMLDLFVVGGGPHALGCLSRLYEPMPNALYNDVEHARLHWIRKHSKMRASKIVPRDVSEGRVPPAKNAAAVDGRFQLENGPKVVVMDKKSAGWLGTWNTFFKAFGIKNLRSPLFFHPHPGDLDALKSYADSHGRSDELIEIGGVVNKEWSKHQLKAARVRGVPPRQPHINLRDASDYYTPSTPLFSDFINEEIVARFSLEDAVQHGTVSSIRFLRPSTGVRSSASGLLTPPSSPGADSDADPYVDEPHFLIKTLDGRTFRSRAVIMAIGPGAIPNVPSYLREPAARTIVDGPGWCHTAAFLQPGFQFPPKQEVALRQRLADKAPATVIIIGGGLTSAQIADLAISKGFKVILLCRSHLKVKAFDVGSEWIGKFSSLFKMVFYQEDDPDARLAHVRQARGGGSVTAPYQKVLKAHIAAGVLDQRTLTSVTSVARDAESGQWTVDVERRCEKKTARVPRKQRAPKRGRKGSDAASGEEDDDDDCGACPHPEIDIQTDVLHADYIVSATGSLFDIEGLPFLKDMNKDFPIRSAGGLPWLTEDLQWAPDVPLLVAGGYANLQLGPGAANLIGAREGAERIANGLGAAFPDVWGEDADWRADMRAAEGGDDSWRKERFGHNGGFYDGLEIE